MQYSKRNAEVSNCERYRYWLQREWDEGRPTLAACMLNPSTADAMVDDGTIRALVGHADRWGYGGLVVVNLYARRASRPEAMFAEVERVGPENEARLAAALVLAENNGGQVLVAWGNDGDFEGEASRFVELAQAAERVSLVCLGTTISGAPLHPAARGRRRPASDISPMPWPAVVTSSLDVKACTCSRAERALLDTLQAWPGRPAIVTWTADGHWSVGEPSSNPS